MNSTRFLVTIVTFLGFMVLVGVIVGYVLIAGFGGTKADTINPWTPPTNELGPHDEALLFINSNSNKSVQISDGRKLLIGSILKNYDKKNYPSNTVLRFGCQLMGLDFIVESNYLKLDAWLSHEWVDPRFQWDPTHFAGETSLILNEDEIWTPDLTLYNTREPDMNLLCQKINLIARHTGEVRWTRPCVMTPRCTFNLDPSPVNQTQTCDLKFGSWSMDGSQLDLQLRDDKMDLSSYEENYDWELVREQFISRNTFHCPPSKATFVDLTAHLALRRRSKGLNNGTTNEILNKAADVMGHEIK